MRSSGLLHALVLVRYLATMRGVQALALRIANTAFGSPLAAAGSRASIFSTASRASYNALQAARPREHGIFSVLEPSTPSVAPSAPWAPFLAAADSAGGIADGSASFGGAWRSKQANLSRLTLAQPFAQHASTLLGSGHAGGRAAEAASWPSRLTSAASGGAAQQLNGWPSRLPELRGLAPLLGRNGHSSRSATSQVADDGAGSGSGAGRLLLLPSRGLALPDTVLGGRWPSSRAAAPSGLFGTLWAGPLRQFSSISGAAGDDDARSSSDFGGAGSRVYERPILIKVGDGQDTDINIPVDDLLAMRRGGFINALATRGGFGVEFEGMPRSKCRVFVLPKVAGKLPTAEEEASAVELVGTTTFGELVAQVDPSSSAYFVRVLTPQVGLAAAAISEETCTPRS